MTRGVIIGIAVFALMAAAAFGGWAWRGERALGAATDAAAQTAACVSGATVAEAAIADLAARFDALRARRDQLMAEAEKTIADRPAEVLHIQARARKRANAIVESRHEDPACAALAALPVCPAVARQLWPAREQVVSGGHAPHRD